MNQTSVNFGWIVLVLFCLAEVSCHSLRSVGGAESSMRTCQGKRGLVRSCLLTPEQTEGPYYYSAERAPVRQNITEGKEGIPLTIYLSVINVDTCEPVSGAVLDMWHCDALGIYSHYVNASSGATNAGTDNTTFLRGILSTNESGIGVLETIFPGWYISRDTHIHMKVHIGGNIANNTYTGGSVVHTGQLFFNDSLSDEVAKISPYSQHNIVRTLLTEDNVYTTQNGSYGLLDVQVLNSTLGIQGGMAAYITLGVTSTSSPSTSSPTTSSSTSSPTTSSTSSPTTSSTSSPTTSSTSSPPSSAPSTPAPTPSQSSSSPLIEKSYLLTVFIVAVSSWSLILAFRS